MDPVLKVSLTIQGRKDVPLAFCKLPDFLVKDIPSLFERALALNPAATIDDVVRSIWRLGSQRLNANLAKGIRADAQANLPQPADPLAKQVESSEATSTQGS